MIRGLVLGKNKVGMPIYWHSDRLIVLVGVLPDSNILIYLLPCVILRDLIFPALSSFRGLSPHYDTNAAAVINIFMLAPNSESMEVAERSFTPGIV